MEKDHQLSKWRLEGVWLFDWKESSRVCEVVKTTSGKIGEGECDHGRGPSDVRACEDLCAAKRN